MKQIEDFINNVHAEHNQRRRVEEYFSYNFMLKNKKTTIESEDLKKHLPYSIVQEVILNA